MPEHDGDRQSDLAVMDANEYKNKRRLERVLDALDTVEDNADEAWELFVTGQISQDARNVIIQRAVKSAIREAYNLLQRHAELTDERDQWWQGRPDDPVGVIPQQRREDIAVVGLRDYLATQQWYREEWTDTESRRGMSDQPVTRAEETTVPQRVSLRAYLRLKRFLSDVHDLEIQFEEIDDSRPYLDWREEFEDGVYGGADSVDLPHKNGGADARG